MDFAALLASALRRALSDPAGAFDEIQRLRAEALAVGATASAATATRSLVLAAVLARDAEAERRFAAEWHASDNSEASARAVRLAGSRQKDVAGEEAIREELALLVEKIVLQRCDARSALATLGALRRRALKADAMATASRCLDEMILASLDGGDTELARRLADDLVLEAPSARAFNMLGRAANACRDRSSAENAFTIADALAADEGDVDEASQAREALDRLGKTGP
jgi:hypothetical protein